jgi:hypothetical protein
MVSEVEGRVSAGSMSGIFSGLQHVPVGWAWMVGQGSAREDTSKSSRLASHSMCCRVDASRRRFSSVCVVCPVCLSGYCASSGQCLSASITWPDSAPLKATCSAWMGPTSTTGCASPSGTNLCSGSWYSCLSCTSTPGCGFCASAGLTFQCQLANFTSQTSGPQYSTCAVGAWTYAPSGTGVCPTGPPDPCNAYSSNCSSCASAPATLNCGYCTNGSPTTSCKTGGGPTSTGPTRPGDYCSWSWYGSPSAYSACTTARDFCNDFSRTCNECANAPTSYNCGVRRHTHSRHQHR